MSKNQSNASPSALVDYSHMGRKITGIERISADLFSPDALAEFDVLHTSHASALGMIRAQWLEIPWLASRNPDAKLLFPGFPPSIAASMLFGKRVIPYIHDLFLLERLDELNIRARLYMRPSFIYAIRHLRNFFVNSKTTEANLRKECRADANIMTLRPRAENVFGFEEIERHMPADNAPLRFVMLGTLEPRKNYEYAAELTGALALKIKRSVELHISGREGWGNIADKLVSFPHVHYHGYLSVSALRDLVGQSHAFLCTSLDEGLGLPLLEVLYSGIPMVVSDIPVFREVASLASSTFIPNTSLEQACAKLAEVLEAPGFFNGSLARAKHATQNWNQLADADMEAFRAFMRRPLALNGGA
ncbi:glycosyltransferase [Uliginosibacterium aquaticum]|uniref:Glycosyltransferase n=1 Tax=Uliginosibacterium aquaticum TaxID=2731212 RepID=A0ABX2ICN0_9RHOO|nr:glycosyltransferase [Uliginosibacterium aquaticum]NSL54032.1 glycosyltransferase [Uliginosibacterium aquaticum]